MKALARLAVTTAVLCTSAIVWAQQPSLADVARKETERRRNVKAPSKVYTNSDLPKPAPTMVTEVKEAGAKDAVPASGEKDQAEPPVAAVEGADKAAADLGQWAQKVADARERLEEARKMVDELQKRVNDLSMAHINEPSYEKKGPLLAERDRAAAELADATAKLAAETKSYTELELQARELTAKKSEPQ